MNYIEDLIEEYNIPSDKILFFDRRTLTVSDYRSICLAAVVFVQTSVKGEYYIYKNRYGANGGNWSFRPKVKYDLPDELFEI